MHVDWSGLSLSGYFEALDAHNEAHDPKGSNRDPASPEFRQTMKTIFDAQKKRKEAGGG